MSWADEKIAHPMGYEHAVLFPRARDAIWAYQKILDGPICLPENICPQVLTGLADDEIRLVRVNDETGLADIPVQLYGYRKNIPGFLEIDPLMTGWGLKPFCVSSIVSFGYKKFISIGYGGAFLTNNENFWKEMCECQWWPFGEDGGPSWSLKHFLDRFLELRADGFKNIYKWDSALGDLLPRIPMEQVTPWRVMRRVPNGKRDAIVKELRARGIPVGTNYPPLTGSNKWGDEVINFFPDCERAEDAARIIYHQMMLDSAPLLYPI